MLDPALLAFIRTSIPSVWALELLMMLRRAAPTALTQAELVQKLRATPLLIDRLLKHFEAVGVVMADDQGGYRFACASPDLQSICDELATAADLRPVALRDAIISAPSDKLRVFSDAFRFKKGKDE